MRKLLNLLNLLLKRNIRFVVSFSGFCVGLVVLFGSTI
jgi:hypothetical protein